MSSESLPPPPNRQSQPGPEPTDRDSDLKTSGPQGLFGTLRLRRVWFCIGLQTGAVDLISNFADFPVVTRWIAWGLLVVVATFIAAGVYMTSWKSVIVTTVGAAAVVGVVAVHLPDLSGTPGGLADPPPQTEPAPAPKPARPAEGDPGDRPIAAQRGLGRWWIADGDASGSVSALDDDALRRGGLTVAHPITDLSWCAGALVMTYGHGWVGRFSPRTGDRLGHYHFGKLSDHVVCGADLILIDKRDAGWIVALDARTLAWRFQVPVHGSVRAMTFGAGVIWVAAANGRNEFVVGIRARDQMVVARVPVMDDVIAINYVGDRPWVTHGEQSCLMRIDVGLEREVGPGIPLGQVPGATTSRDGMLYVGDYADGSLRAVDATTGRPAGLAVRMGTLRITGLAVHAGRLLALDEPGGRAVVIGPDARAALREMPASATPRRSRECPLSAG